MSNYKVEKCPFKKDKLCTYSTGDKCQFGYTSADQCILIVEHLNFQNWNFDNNKDSKS